MKINTVDSIIQDFREGQNIFRRPSVELMVREISRLQARVQELEQERRWIPVSERLPEDSRIYDVAIADYEYSWTGTCVFGKWIGESGKAILGVTHWKYRPQPPQEEE